MDNCSKAALALMDRTANVDLSPFTTLRVGGPARELVLAGNVDGFVEAVRLADEAGSLLFVLGDGSNVLIGDCGVDGTVVKPVYGYCQQERRNDDIVRFKVGAGTRWDEFVENTVACGIGDLAALSGIPGLIGSAVMQNIGAYGAEISACLVSALLYDRSKGCVEERDAGDLKLGYRSSMLRESLESMAFGLTPRWVVLEATFELRANAQAVIGNTQLAKALGRGLGETVEAASMRAAVLDIRAQKAMLRDADPDGPSPDHDRWSSGSFFKNPIVGVEAASRLPDDAPRYDSGKTGFVKTSAAWLIERAGFERGYRVRPDSPASLSTRHTLALTNRGGACARDIVELARVVREGVRRAFDIELEPETVLVGCAL